MDPTRRGGSAFYPIGTLPEADRLHLDLTNVATCSQRTARNLGCPYFSLCRFREIRDGHQPKGFDAPLQAPENVAVFRQLSPSEGGDAAIIETTCFGYYLSGLHERRQQMDATGEIVKVLGIAGDGKKYRFRETVRAHTKKDPNCDDCMANKCVKTETRYVEKSLERFKRPEARFHGHALGVEIRSQVMDEMDREKDEAAFAPYIVAEEEADQGSGKAPQARGR